MLPHRTFCGCLPLSCIQPVREFLIQRVIQNLNHDNAMRRACKVTLKFTTAHKRRAIDALLSRYRHAVNFYIKSLWETRGKLDGITKARLTNTELSERYKSEALKRALEIVVYTKKTAKATGKQASCPHFTGSATLSWAVTTIEDGHGSFDLIVRLSSLVSGKRIVIPTKRTAVLNKWMAVPGAKLVQGISLSENVLILWVDVPDQDVKSCGSVVGVDIGKNKMVVDSDSNQYGTGFKTVLDKVNRRLPGSRGRSRSHAERENYSGYVLNRLPWQDWKVLGVEALHDMKRGKQKKRSRSFRKAIASWLYRRVLDRIEHKAAENRVRLIAVNPAYTSRTCPSCRGCDEHNRRGERFQCVCCGYTADADHVGALNVLVRTRQLLGSLQSSRLKKSGCRKL